MKELALAAALAAAVAFATGSERAPCHTDSECAAACPASDMDCDGGPQS
jgi:coenzyme F420-reducing hydrogenase gamma subunit